MNNYPSLDILYKFIRVSFGILSNSEKFYCITAIQILYSLYWYYFENFLDLQVNYKE